MKQLIDALLQDENGISAEAYSNLLEYLETFACVLDMDEKQDAFDAMHKMAKEAQALVRYVKLADATDDRFYFSE